MGQTGLQPDKAPTRQSPEADGSVAKDSCRVRAVLRRRQKLRRCQTGRVRTRLHLGCSPSKDNTSPNALPVSQSPGTFRSGEPFHHRDIRPRTLRTLMLFIPLKPLLFRYNSRPKHDGRRR